MDPCLFSGEKADSEEHVIPRWMQRRFALHRASYKLPNSTTFSYSRATIPVSQHHNNRFGVIENRVASGNATPQETYLWALKIHLGLIYRTSALRIDIKRPDSPTFWNVDDFDHEVKIFRMLYEAWSNGGVVDPSPFGSVFRLDALTPEPIFDFVHEIRSGTVYFQLGDKLLFVSLWDQSDGLTYEYPFRFEDSEIAGVASRTTTQAQYFAKLVQRSNLCQAAYVMLRSRRPMIFSKFEDNISVIPGSGPPYVRPVDRDELAHFCFAFGLRLEENNGNEQSFVYQFAN